MEQSVLAVDFLNTNHLIGWAECLQNDLFCVALDVKLRLSQSVDLAVGIWWFRRRHYIFPQ